MGFDAVAIRGGRFLHQLPRGMSGQRWTARRRATFLETLRQSANVSDAARRAGLSRGAAYSLRAVDPAFRAAWDDALEEALDALEAELRRRAIEGVEKPVFYGGKPCGTITSYSDQLGMFLLKCRRPEVFAGKQEREAGDDSERERAGAKADLAARLSRLAQACGEPDQGDS